MGRRSRSAALDGVEDGPAVSRRLVAVGPGGGGVDYLCAKGVDVLDPEGSGAVQDVVEDDDGDEDVGRGSALEIHLLTLFVAGRVHGGREVDHPGQDGLDEGVVHQVDGEADAAEEVEDGRGQHAAGGGGEEDAEEDGGSANVVPVAAYVGFVGGDGLHHAGHGVGPVGVVGGILWEAGHEHA